jgi:prepilin-type N-terminal cleavage/methylation domain-containing protein
VRDEKGVTLIELLISVTILGMIMAATNAFYSSGARGWADGNTRAELQQSARVAMDELSNELIWASDVAITANGSHSNTAITYKKNSRTYKFLLQDGNLKIELPDGTVTTVANNILSVQAVSTGKIIELTVAAEKQGRQVVLRAKVSPRNL